MIGLRTAREPDILVVGDCADRRLRLEQILPPQYRVRTADCLERATRAISARVPDLLIFDVLQTDGNGFQLFAKRKENPRTAELRVLFVSICGDVRDKVLAFSVGADDYMFEPAGSGQLRARIVRSLQARGRSSVVRCGARSVWTPLR